MEYLDDALNDHFCQEVLVCASQLLSSQPNNPKGTLLLNTVEKFGEDLFKCIQGIPAAQVID